MEQFTDEQKQFIRTTLGEWYLNFKFNRIDILVLGVYVKQLRNKLLNEDIPL